MEDVVKYKLLKGINDVKTLYPKLMLDWDYSENTKDPSDLLPSSVYRASWVCHKCGHKWITRLDSRIKNNHSCPVCSKSGGSSINDYTLYYYLKEVFVGDVFYRYKVLPNTEADVYIRSKNIVIEYDGYGFHKNSYEKDKEKCFT